MMKIFAFCNQKGGVGKTTSAVNIAAALAKAGRKVLLIDVDPQGNATSGVGLEKNELEKTIYHVMIGHFPCSEVIVQTSVTNLYILPSNAHLAGAEVELSGHEDKEQVLKKMCGEVRSEYDFVFLDCPPSLGLLTFNALAMSDGILIPLQCEYYALEGLGQLLGTYQLVKERLNDGLDLSGVLLTMADFRTNLTQQVIDDVRSHFEDRVFKTVIPRSVRISEAPSFGKPVTVYDPSSKGAVAYEKAAEEFLERFWVSPTKDKAALEAVTEEPNT